MTATATRTDRDTARRERSHATFLARKAAVDALISRLAAASEDHFGADPEGFLWGAEGSLGRVEELLREAADFIGA